MSEDTHALNDGPNNEASILSFIVRVWREETSTENQLATWRGHIRPLMGGERAYFRDINEIPDLITSFLKRTK